MRKITISLLTILAFSNLSCEKETKTTIENNSSSNSSNTTTKSEVYLNVVDLEGKAHSDVEVVMSADSIALGEPFTIDQTVISNAEGVAKFDMEGYVSAMPMTYFFAAVRDGQNGVKEIRGTLRLEGVKENTKRTNSILLLK